MQKRASARNYHVVYRTTCVVTNRFYIGLHSTDDLEDGYLGSGQRLWKSIKKHGKEKHICEILEHLPTRSAAADREKQLVALFWKVDPLCLNLGPGGLGATDRPPDSAETRIRRSLAQRGKVRTPEMRERYSAAKAGTVFSKEHLDKLSAAKKGKPLSLKQRENHSNGQAGRCTIDGETIYESKSALARALGHGKLGARSPSFRYVDDTRYVQSDEQRHKARTRMLGKPHNWKSND